MTHWTAIIQPLNTAVQYVNQISKGEIPAKITADARGEFNHLRTA